MKTVRLSSNVSTRKALHFLICPNAMGFDNRRHHPCIRIVELNSGTELWCPVTLNPDSKLTAVSSVYIGKELFGITELVPSVEPVIYPMLNERYQWINVPCRDIVTDLDDISESEPLDRFLLRAEAFALLTAVRISLNESFIVETTN